MSPGKALVASAPAKPLQNKQQLWELWVRLYDIEVSTLGAPRGSPTPEPHGTTPAGEKAGPRTEPFLSCRSAPSRMLSSREDHFPSTEDITGLRSLLVGTSLCQHRVGQRASGNSVRASLLWHFVLPSLPAWGHGVERGAVICPSLHREGPLKLLSSSAPWQQQYNRCKQQEKGCTGGT